MLTKEQMERAEALVQKFGSIENYERAMLASKGKPVEDRSAFIHEYPTFDAKTGVKTLVRTVVFGTRRQAKNGNIYANGPSHTSRVWRQILANAEAILERCDALDADGSELAESA